MNWEEQLPHIWKLVEWMKGLFRIRPGPDECRHCNGTGTCRNESRSYGTYSCRTCIRATDPKQWDTQVIVACSICRGTGRYVVPGANLETVIVERPVTIASDEQLALPEAPSTKSE